MITPGTRIYAIERDVESDDGAYIVSTFVCKSSTRNGWVTWVSYECGVELDPVRGILEDYYPTINEAAFHTLTNVHSTHWAKDVPKILEAFQRYILMRQLITINSYED